MATVTQIAKWGNSLGLRLPKSVALEAQVDEGDTVDVSVKNGAIVIRPSRPTYSLERFVAKITPRNRHDEDDWVSAGRPRGVVARAYVPDAGDLVWLTFDPQAGHEQRGRRPALILSPRAYNAKARLAIACPITSQVKGYPFEVPLPTGGKIWVLFLPTT